MSTHLAAMNATALQKPDLRIREDSLYFVPQIASRTAFSNPILRPGPRPRVSLSAEREESIER